MKSVIVAFVCVLYCCQAAVTRGEGVVIDGKNETIPEVTVITTETTKIVSPENGSGKNTKYIPPGPSNITTTSTTITPITTHAPNTTTVPTTTTHAPNTTTVPTTTTHAPNTTTHAPNTTTPATPTTPKPTNGTTVTPSPSSSAAPIISTTVVPPSNRGFDGPSFIGGIVLASGLMAIGFVALKFYRARTELNYHTL